MDSQQNLLDIARQLTTDEEICEILSEVLAVGTSSDFIRVLNIAARTKGMTVVARETGVTRTSLYKSLSEDGNPRFETIYEIIKVLGGRLTIVID